MASTITHFLAPDMDGPNMEDKHMPIPKSPRNLVDLATIHRRTKPKFSPTIAPYPIHKRELT